MDTLALPTMHVSDFRAVSESLDPDIAQSLRKVNPPSKTSDPTCLKVREKCGLQASPVDISLTAVAKI